MDRWKSSFEFLKVSKGVPPMAGLADGGQAGTLPNETVNR